ncbi:MAG: hypothetical protein GX063_06450 [Firmicutes bacterium]|nr:hypothetical protein [Bacillota bacterium]
MQANGRLVLRARGIWLVFTLVLLAALGGIAEGSGVVKASKQTINIEIDAKPADEYVYSEESLTLAWERVNLEEEAQGTNLDEAKASRAGDTKYIYYEVSDLKCGELEIPADYIEAWTPYSGGYQPLNKPVPFLKADEEKPAEIKFRIRREAWKHAGQFRGYLTSTSPLAKHGVIGFNVDVKECISLVVDTGSGQGSVVVVNADQGPGTYTAEQLITVKATTNTRGSTLTVSCDGLKFESSEKITAWEQGSVPVIEPDAIWLREVRDISRASSDNSGSTGFSLANGKGIVFSCPNGTTEYLFEVRVKTELRHIAGIYRGNIRFTLAN